MKILLLQARLEDDPMVEHEQLCFSERSGLGAEAFEPLNMTCEAMDAACLDDVDAVMIGGSGDFSVANGGFEWHASMLALLQEIVRRAVPTFGSCFGHQALAQSLGGEVIREPEQGELGTFEISLNEQGRQDHLFGTMPERFMAQLGHYDRISRLPQGVENLASSTLCEFQALRVSGTSIVTTQFHPELSGEAQLERWMRYIHHYTAPGETVEEARSRARSYVHPSPEASGLLERFVEVELGIKP